MAKLHTVVCLKVVPKPEEIQVDEETRRLERADVRSELNPPDMNAMEMALRLKDRYGARISIVTMGPPYFEPFLRVGLAMGADHIYLLSDREFGGADTLATTYTLAKGIEKIGDVDLILCGEESSDGATGQVPPGLAEWLGIEQITMVEDVEIKPRKREVRGRREIKGGYEVLEAPMPVVVSAKVAANEPRFMDYSIKEWAFEKGRVTVWTKDDLDVDEEYIGVPGSPTVVSDLGQAETRERRREFLEGDVKDMAEKVVRILEEVL